jgi:argininosuccinate lyase
LEKKCELDALSLDELRSFSPAIDKDVFEVLSVDGSVDSRISTGGTSLQRVTEALGAAEKHMGI